MMKNYFFCLVLSSQIANASDLQTVPFLELNRYLGLWHEIARFPNSFERDCVGATAQYTSNSDGSIKVVNQCIKADAKSSSAEGVAEVVDRQSNSKLRVNFLPAFFRWLGIGWGNYWVIDLDQNYQYSVVSEPTKEYLWILARQAKLPQDVLNRILGNLKALGFDLSKLKIN